ncbi:hypothetical protein DSM100688_1576 [Bifidobacterium ramosum]|nr:hypothetical protein DSM100688_1576 [Bifidobacterium ramosum]
MLRDLILPRGCAGCDMPDAVLCPSCTDDFDHDLARPMPGTVTGLAHACAVYTGAARRAILSWKDHGDEECDEPFARRLANTAMRSGMMSDDETSGRESRPLVSSSSRNRPSQPIVLVPAPSSRASMTRRGRWHMRAVAERTAAILRGHGIAVEVRPWCRTVNVAAKSVETMSSAQRNARIRGNIVVTDPAACHNRTAIVVDDIITTGATMRQCVGALTDQGARVVGALALASVQRDDAA